MAGNKNSGRKPYSAQQIALTGQQMPRGRVEQSGPQDVKITSLEDALCVEGYSSMSARAKRIYKTLCGRFIAMGLLEPLYLMSLYMLACDFDHLIDLERDIRKNGRYVVRQDASGQVSGAVLNPAYTLFLKTQDSIRMIGSNFGLSPAERRKIMASGAPQSVTVNIFDAIRQQADEQDVAED